MAMQFTGRPKPKQRPIQSPYSAVVDTAGMDPEMKATLSGTQGPGASAGGGIKFDPIADLKKMLGHLFDFGKKK